MSQRGPRNAAAELPEDWALTRIRDLCERMFGGGTPSTKNESYWNGPIPWTTTAVIGEDETYLERFQRGITSDGLGNSSSQLAPSGSILVGTRVGVGKAAVAAFDIAINQDLTALVPNGKVVPAFLALCLKQPKLQRWFEANKRGTTIKGVTRNDLADLEIPLPPLTEQRAIARVLGTVQEAKRATEKVIAAARALKQSLMRHLFTYGPVRFDQADQVELQETEAGMIPGRWEVVSLGRVSEFLQYGTSERCDLEAVGTPVLRIPNVVGDSIDLTELKYIQLGENETAKLRLAPGDLLFVRTNGQRDYVGRCAVYHGEPRNCLFASYLIRSRLKTDQVLPQFVQIYSRLPAGRGFLSGRASRASDGKFNINTQILRAVMLPRPSLDEQREIVRVVDAVQRVQRAGEGRLAALDALFQTLLHHLMTGRIRVNHLDQAGAGATEGG